MYADWEKFRLIVSYQRPPWPLFEFWKCFSQISDFLSAAYTNDLHPVQKWQYFRPGMSQHLSWMEGDLLHAVVTVAPFTLQPKSVDFSHIPAFREIKIEISCTGVWILDTPAEVFSNFCSVNVNLVRYRFCICMTLLVSVLMRAWGWTHKWSMRIKTLTLVQAKFKVF